MYIRPNHRMTVSANCINTVLRGASVLGALLAQLIAVNSTALAQPSTAPKSVVLDGHLGGAMKSILGIRVVGAPIVLPDGRVEQHYRVSANVAFGLTASTAGDIKICDAARTEVPLTDFSGAPGFYAELIVRSATTGTQLAIVARPIQVHTARNAQAQASPLPDQPK